MNNQIQIEITGKNPKHFLNEMIRHKINIYLIEHKENQLRLLIDYKDYPKLLTIKTASEIKIIKRYGKNQLFWFFKKYKYFLCFLCMGLIWILFLSHLIFKIEIIHSNQKLKDLVIKDLDELGIKKYHWKVSYKEKEKIKETILKKEKKWIEWLEIKEIGTKYIISLEQRKNPPSEEACKERNIIAKKNAVIMEISSSKGEIVKKQNDYVEKGEVLISGWIHNKETTVSKRCATGKVYGETWYKVKLRLPQTKQEKQETKEKSYGIFLLLGKKQYNLGNKFEYYQKKEYNIIRGDVIPFGIGMIQYKKIKISKKKISQQELEEQALKIAEQNLLKKNPFIKQVLSKKVLKKQAFDSKIEIDVFMKVKEDITDYEDISNINIEEMNQKKE